MRLRIAVSDKTFLGKTSISMKFGVVFITEEVSVTHRDRLEN
jgi:hypothetical protein